MTHYSAFSLFKQALGGNKGWSRAWRDATPKPSYDVIIIGGGGHGLATAYYLAKNHGITNVAVIEKGYIGGGNTGRNTTIVRSNYMIDGNTNFYEHSLKLWEGMSRDLNFNVMYSPRGQINLAHSPAQMDAAARRGNIMRMNGIDAELLSREDLKKRIPILDYSDTARFPIMGGLWQSRAGTARHDAVAWGYARGASDRGVDIIQGCEVTGYLWDRGRIVGVETTRGEIKAKKVGMAVAGHTSHMARKAGLTLPIETHILQAFVSEGLKPVIHHVITSGVGHFYISQSDKGGLVFGGALDMYASYAQRGNLPGAEHVMEAAMHVMPMIGKARVLRSWGGIMDMTPDGSPIIDRTPVDGLYIDCGWNYGGFKATPASGFAFAHLLATDRPHASATRFRLDRFRTGRGIMDEEGAGAQHNLH